MGLVCGHSGACWISLKLAVGGVTVDCGGARLPPWHPACVCGQRQMDSCYPYSLPADELAMNSYYTACFCKYHFANARTRLRRKVPLNPMYFLLSCVYTRFDCMCSKSLMSIQTDDVDSQLETTDRQTSKQTLRVITERRQKYKHFYFFYHRVFYTRGKFAEMYK